MEPLVVTRVGVWAEVEILQWMERNTRVFKTNNIDGYHFVYTESLNSHYESTKKINEVLR